MRSMMLLILFAMSSVASADIYKCKQPDGKTVYQSTPCREMKDLGAVEIKNDRSSTDTMENAYDKQENLREKDAAIKSKLEAESAERRAKEEAHLAEVRHRRAQCDLYTAKMNMLLGTSDWKTIGAIPQVYYPQYVEYRASIAQWCH